MTGRIQGVVMLWFGSPPNVRNATYANTQQDLVRAEIDQTAGLG